SLLLIFSLILNLIFSIKVFSAGELNLNLYQVSTDTSSFTNATYEGGGHGGETLMKGTKDMIKFFKK
ncbi:hypothetical protein LR002_01585, partial [Candidatus Gracilibacteria bacterium]|nr:hypothetical protein [Candidatus Gracilibacteria bacterium]